MATQIRPLNVEPDEFITLADGPSIADERWLNGDAPQQPFQGLTHAQVLKLEFPEERMLVHDLVPIGAVGTIAGVPETYKSWQAQTLAIGVASGDGQVLGHDIAHQGRVGYFWQDDSTREEAERIKMFHQVRGGREDLPVQWFLNEGLRLPDDMHRLRRTVDHHEFILVVLDSFYNVLLGDLKDDEAERVIAMLKSDVCDATGCTVLIVDHMPWATEQNRKRLRAYGGVHKGAAIRFGIYIDAVNNSLYVEARGNNITGFNRRPAEWDAERLELRLLDAPDAVTGEEYEQRILDYLTDNPNATTDDLKTKVKGTTADLVAARGRLLAQNQLVRHRERTNSGPYLWNRSIQAENTGSTPQTNQHELGDWFGGSTGSPLRGDNQNELLTETPANRTDDDEFPF
jgi:AAA domain-containing protein